MSDSLIVINEGECGEPDTLENPNPLKTPHPSPTMKKGLNISGYLAKELVLLLTKMLWKMRLLSDTIQNNILIYNSFV